MVKWEEIDLGNDLTKVRKELKAVEFEEGINILALQPGVGKTTKIKEYLKDKDKWLVTVPNYNLIDSEYDEIINMDGVSYWKGFKKECRKYLENENQVPYFYDTAKLMPNVICGKVCSPEERKKCSYKKQFNSSDKVITVSHFYNTPLFYDNGKFKFDIAIIDEELSGYDKLEINEKKIDESIELIRDYLNYEILEGETDHSIIPPFNEIIENREFYSPECDYPIGDIVFSGVEAEKDEALDKAFESGNLKDYKTIYELDFLKLKKWLYYYFIYKEDRMYGDPHIYKLFDLARQGVKVVFSDASFSKRIFSKLLERYLIEEEKLSRRILFKKYIIEDEDFKDFKLPYKIDKIRLFTSSIQDKNKTIFYKMWRARSFSKTSFQNGENPIELLDFHKKINRKFFKPAIISYISIWAKYLDLTKFGEFAYFWNLRGVNKFKDEEILILVGTPVPNTNKLLKDYNSLFIEIISEDNVEADKYNKYKIDLDGFEYYRRYKIDSEIYQAVHRIRPFNNSNKIILVFGYVPEELIKEFDVVGMTKSTTIKFFENNFNGVYPVALARSLVDYHWLNPEATSQDIAKAFKLYKMDKKKGYNTKLVTAVINNKVKSKIIYKLDKELKNVNNNDDDIINKFKKSEIDDENLKHLIYYARIGKDILLP